MGHLQKEGPDMAFNYVASVIFFVAALVGQIQSQTCPEAPKCVVSECKLPDCFCSGNETELVQQEVEQGHKKPQIVYLTFDDALSNLASTQFYEELFGTPTNHTYSNPNGCALRATHFITHSYTDYKSVQDCPIEPCPQCSHPGLWEQPMIDLEDEWIGANPQTPNNGNPCSMLDACTVIPHDSYGEEDPQKVYDMLMKNFKRVYEGDEDGDGELVPGNRAPWGLYMHAAWFFGDYGWHFTGYKQFIAEIASYDDVWIVPIEAGLDYMRTIAFDANLSNEQLKAQGKDNGPFACKDIEEKTG